MFYEFEKDGIMVRLSEISRVRRRANSVRWEIYVSGPQLTVIELKYPSKASRDAEWEQLKLALRVWRPCGDPFRGSGDEA